MNHDAGGFQRRSGPAPLISGSATNPRVGVVIVNYMKSTRVIEGLDLLRKQSCFNDLSVVIVDNSMSVPEEQTLRQCAIGPEMLIIAHGNLGYTQGVNLAAKNVGDCEFMLLMNPDIIVRDGEAIQKLRALMVADPSICVLTGLQRNDDGSVVEVARRFPSFPKLVLRRLMPGRFDDYDILLPLSSSKPIPMLDVDWVQSSFMIVRTSFWKGVGGLDERYYIFMSDVDLCYKARQCGMRVSVTSLVEVEADGLRASRGSIGSVFRSAALRVHIRDALLYQMIALGRTLSGIVEPVRFKRRIRASLRWPRRAAGAK